MALSANLLAGGSADGTSYMIDINWFKQNDNTIADYSRSRTTDFASLGPKGADDSSQSNWPFNVDLGATQAAAAGLASGTGYYVISGGAPTASPTLSQFAYAGADKANISDVNRYNYAPTSQIVPSQDNWNLLFEGAHDFNTRVSGFIQVGLSDDRTEFLYTPDTINSTTITTNNASTLTVGATPTYLSIPADNPYNPFGSVLGGSSSASDSFVGRALFGPTRTYDVDSKAGSLLLGLNGDEGNDWNWTSTLSYGSDLVAVDANNNIRAIDMQNALDGTLPGYQGSFLNPFGPSANQAMVDSLFVTSVSSAKDSAYDAEFSASGPLFTLPSGPVSMAAGGEWRQEELDNDADTTNYIVNPTSGSTPFSGSRTVTSEYLEVDVPAAGRLLDLQMAVRHDNYNEFGGTTNPKFAAVSSPFRFLKLRGSYSQSFKAPDLGQLYLSPITTYSATNTLDPLNPQVPGTVYPQLQGGNPNLRPERGKVWYLGGVIDLDPVARGLSLSVDHFDFAIGNAITTFTNPTALFTLFPNLVVRGPPTVQAPNGPIQYFDFVPINAAAYYWRGFDLGLRYDAPPTPIGKFSVDIEATRIIYFGYDAGTGLGPVDKAGLYNYPRWTGNVLANWSKGAAGMGLAVLYKGPYLDNANAAVWGENPIALFNGTVYYDIPGWHTRVTLGCDNILNTPPPPDGLASPSDGFDVNTYSAWAVGRFVSLRVKKKF
jgi:outer membrane receptor protein involved in Fe transport